VGNLACISGGGSYNEEACAGGEEGS